MIKVKPSKVRLEASSFCQLRCPACPTTSKAIHPAIGSGFLRLADFQKFVDENPFIKEIELSNYGEIFLNPDMLEILEYAYQRNVALTAGNGANLNHVKEKVLEGIVKYQLRTITCSLDGATNETYTKYRIKGDFDRVIANLRKINQYKEKYNSIYPKLLWQFVAFGHNEHEISQAETMARELGMHFHVKLSWDNKLSPVKDETGIVKKWGEGASSRDEYKRLHGKDYMDAICHQLWDNPQINWDGKLLGCCRNYWGDFGKGNVFKDGVMKSVNNKKMIYARKMLLGIKPARADIPCTSCEIYLGMQSKKTWMIRSSSAPFLARVFYQLRQFFSKFPGSLYQPISKIFL